MEKENLQKEFKQMWSDFVASVQSKGHEIVLMPVIKPDMVESMNQREKNLVAIICNTYLTGAVQFVSQEQLKQSQAPQEEISVPDKKQSEELSKPE